MISNKYKLHVSSIIIIGLALSIYLSYTINIIENKSIQNRFENIANNKLKSFHTEIILNLETLYSMAILFNSNRTPTKEQFKFEANKIINRHLAIQALEWIPKVSHNQRELYEKDHIFTKQSSNNKMIQVEDKETYYPVYYIEPLQNNEKALGFDLSSNPTRNETIKKSLETKLPQMTQIVNLVQNKKGFLAFLPILDETKSDIKGFILGVFVLQDIFKKSMLHDNISKDINYEIYDTTNQEKSLIYSFNTKNKLYKHLYYEKNMPTMWFRQWSFKMTPSLNYINERKSIVTELSLLLGILLTIIVSYRLNRFHNQKLESIQKLKNKDEILYIQSRYATIGEALSNIEHQWRSPLSKLSSNIITLQSDIEFKEIPSKEKLLSSFENMQNTLKYMSSIVDEFKNFHIVDKKKVLFDFDHTLDVALKLLEHDFTKLNITFMRPSKMNISKLYGFQNEFSQVLINILSNSKEAFIERKVKNPLIQILSYQDKDKNVITIRDNAGGIDEKHIKNIFQQFYTTKKSSGIGLHLSNMIIHEHMKGKISVENSTFHIHSKKHSGATFKIELPIPYEKTNL